MNEEMKKPTFEEVVELLKDRKAVLFGSRAWGRAEPKSDYDYFMVLSEAENFKEWVKSRGFLIQDNDYYVSGYYFFVDCNIINITGIKFPEYGAWESATEMMMNAPVEYLHDHDRKMLFESTLAILRHSMTEQKLPSKNPPPSKDLPF